MVATSHACATHTATAQPPRTGARSFRADQRYRTASRARHRASHRPPAGATWSASPAPRHGPAAQCAAPTTGCGCSAPQSGTALGACQPQPASCRDSMPTRRRTAGTGAAGPARTSGRRLRSWRTAQLCPPGSNHLQIRAPVASTVVAQRPPVVRLDKHDPPVCQPPHVQRPACGLV